MSHSMRNTNTANNHALLLAGSGLFAELFIIGVRFGLPSG